MSCLAGHLSARTLITILMDWDCCCSDSSVYMALTGREKERAGNGERGQVEKGGQTEGHTKREGLAEEEKE